MGNCLSHFFCASCKHSIRRQGTIQLLDKPRRVEMLVPSIGPLYGTTDCMANVVDVNNDATMPTVEEGIFQTCVHDDQLGPWHAKKSVQTFSDDQAVCPPPCLTASMAHRNERTPDFLPPDAEHHNPAISHAFCSTRGSKLTFMNSSTHVCLILYQVSADRQLNKRSEPGNIDAHERGDLEGYGRSKSMGPMGRSRSWIPATR